MEKILLSEETSEIETLKAEVANLRAELADLKTRCVLKPEEEAVAIPEEKAEEEAPQEEPEEKAEGGQARFEA